MAIITGRDGAIAWWVDAPAQELLTSPVPARVVVAPTQIAKVQAAELVIAVAGYPTGRHHSLIKAAEARLAIQSGAAEVWLCVDGHIQDINTHLAELVAVRDACPRPARLGLILPQALAPVLPSLPAAWPTSLADAAAQAGFDRLIVPPASDRLVARPGSGRLDVQPGQVVPPAEDQHYPLPVFSLALAAAHETGN